MFYTKVRVRVHEPFPINVNPNPAPKRQVRQTNRNNKTLNKTIDKLNEQLTCSGMLPSCLFDSTVRLY
jgi:hypothetical protein